jgi:hypothetical protein
MLVRLVQFAHMKFKFLSPLLVFRSEYNIVLSINLLQLLMKLIC